MYIAPAAVDFNATSIAQLSVLFGLDLRAIGISVGQQMNELLKLAAEKDFHMTGLILS